MAPEDQYAVVGKSTTSVATAALSARDMHAAGKNEPLKGFARCRCEGSARTRSNMTSVIKIALWRIDALGYRLPSKAMPGHADRLGEIPTTPFRASGRRGKLEPAEEMRSSGALGRVAADCSMPQSLAQLGSRALTPRAWPHGRKRAQRSTLTRKARRKSRKSPTDTWGNTQPNTPTSAII